MSGEKINEPPKGTYDISCDKALVPWHEATPAVHMTGTAVRVKNEFSGAICCHTHLGNIYLKGIITVGKPRPLCRLLSAEANNIHSLEGWSPTHKQM